MAQHGYSTMWFVFIIYIYIYIKFHAHSARTQEVINSLNCSLHFWGLQNECRCQMASRALKDILVGVCSLQSVCSLYGVTLGQQPRKEELLVVLMLSCLCLFLQYLNKISATYRIMLTMAGLWSLKDVWVFKSNWDMQCEPWLTVHAYFGFLLLWEHHDITVSRQ